MGPEIALVILGCSAFLTMTLVALVARRGRPRPRLRLHENPAASPRRTLLVGIAAEFGMPASAVPVSNPEHPRLSGRVDGLPVSIEEVAGHFRVSAQGTFTDIQIDAREPEEAHQPSHTGDPSFDESLVVRGSKSLFLLDSRTRLRLAESIAHGTSVRDGAAITYVPLDGPRQDLVYALRNVIAVALALSPTEGPAIRLQAMAEKDPIPDVRLHALRALLAEHRNTKEATRAVEKGLSEVEPEHRLEAAIASDRSEVVRSLAQDRRCSEDLRLRAFHRLATAEPARADLELLVSLLDRRTPVLATAAFRRASSRNTILPIATLMGFLEDSTPALQRDAVLAIAMHEEKAEAALVAMLARPREAEVAMAIISSLERWGTAIAVEPLRSLDHFGAGELRHASRSAIARIQERLGASAGQLSIAAPSEAEGRLSVKDPSGAVSMAEVPQKDRK